MRISDWSSDVCSSDLPRSRGTNDLIRKGATLVESAEDVLGILADAPGERLRDSRSEQFRAAPAPASIPTDEPTEREIDAIRGTILELLGPSPVAVDRSEEHTSERQSIHRIHIAAC